MVLILFLIVLMFFFSFRRNVCVKFEKVVLCVFKVDIVFLINFFICVYFKFLWVIFMILEIIFLIYVIVNIVEIFVVIGFVKSERNVVFLLRMLIEE